MIHYFSMWDKTYAHHGLTMRDSLRRHNGDVSFRVFTFERQHIPGAMYIGDYPELQNVRDHGPKGVALFWTMEIACLKQILDMTDPNDLCVYVDADQWFTSSVHPLYDVFQKSHLVGLTPHHFPPGQEEREQHAGRFNYGFAIWRNSTVTKLLVYDLLQKTMSRCDANECGHQRYFDELASGLGDAFCELPETVNVGPWSLPVIKHDPPIYNEQRLISFHFHECRRVPNGTQCRNPAFVGDVKFNLSNYSIHESTRKCVYAPYIRELARYLPSA